MRRLVIILLFSFKSKSVIPAQVPAVKSAVPKQPEGPKVLSVQELQRTFK